MAVFLVPFGIVQYMPNLFYGALLALFGIEITMDWLIHSYRKARRPPTPPLMRRHTSCSAASPSTVSMSDVLPCVST